MSLLERDLNLHDLNRLVEAEVAELAEAEFEEEYPDEDFYPDGDGEPVAETIEHRDALFYLASAGRYFYKGRQDVWVSGNDFLYYKEGDPTKRVSPDFYIVLNVLPDKERPSFRVWEENGRTPNLIVELTSRKTAKQDDVEKMALYQNVLRVPEYILFNPKITKRKPRKPRLRGFRLENGVYVPITLDEQGRIVSRETGLIFAVDGALLRLIHPDTGEVLRTFDEAETAAEAQTKRADTEAQYAQQERQRADAEAQARQVAEENARQMAQELARLRALYEPQNAPANTDTKTDTKPNPSA